MTGADWRAALLRFGVLLIALILLAGLLALVFAAGGRPPQQAAAAGSGVVGVGIAAAGLVLLGIARGRSGRVTQTTGLGALALSIPFLVVALAA